MQDADPGALEGYAKRAAVRVQRASRGMLYEQAEAGALARPGWSSRLFGWPLDLRSLLESGCFSGPKGRTHLRANRA